MAGREWLTHRPVRTLEFLAGNQLCRRTSLFASTIVRAVFSKASPDFVTSVRTTPGPRFRKHVVAYKY
jgi:hypothetical protein